MPGLSEYVSHPYPHMATPQANALNADVQPPQTNKISIRFRAAARLPNTDLVHLDTILARTATALSHMNEEVVDQP